MTLAALFTIHVNLCTMEFTLILSEANFMEDPKIRENYGPQRKFTLWYLKSYNNKASTTSWLLASFMDSSENLVTL